MIAAGSLARASTPEDLEAIRPQFETQPGDQLLRERVIAGLPKGRQSSFEFLKKTFPSWRGIAQNRAVNIIASVDLNDARKFLYALILDETEGAELRKAAARACCCYPRKEDTDVVKTLLRKGDEDHLALAMECLIGAFGKRGKEDALPGVRQILGIANREETKIKILDYLLTYGDGADLPVLRRLIAQGELIPELKRKSMMERLGKMESHLLGVKEEPKQP